MSGFPPKNGNKGASGRNIFLTPGRCLSRFLKPRLFIIIKLTARRAGGKIITDMEPVYIVAIVVSALMFVLLIISFCVIAKRRKEDEERRVELDAVYSDPKLAKMEYDIAFYDDDIPRPEPSREDKQVTIDEVIAGEAEPRFTAVESAIFTKADDGMEEISGHYEPDDK